MYSASEMDAIRGRVRDLECQLKEAAAREKQQRQEAERDRRAAGDERGVLVGLLKEERLVAEKKEKEAVERATKAVMAHLEKTYVAQERRLDQERRAADRRVQEEREEANRRVQEERDEANRRVQEEREAGDRRLDAMMTECNLERDRMRKEARGERSQGQRHVNRIFEISSMARVGAGAGTAQERWTSAPAGTGERRVASL